MLLAGAFCKFSEFAHPPTPPQVCKSQKDTQLLTRENVIQPELWS